MSSKNQAVRTFCCTDLAQSKSSGLNVRHPGPGSVGLGRISAFFVPHHIRWLEKKHTQEKQKKRKEKQMTLVNIPAADSLGGLCPF
jgi:hypothetical protein